jgi:lon-related putative ATP-dependent protease
MPLKTVNPITIELLRRRFDPELIPFESSLDSEACREDVLGQDRAKEALQFGLSMHEPGFHIFVSGPRRTGKTYLVKHYLEKLAKDLPTPPDWVYVHNFKEPDKPKALKLEPGDGKLFASEMKRLISRVALKIPAMFEGGDYAKTRDAMTQKYKGKRAEIFTSLEQDVAKQGYVLRFEQSGVMVAPADPEGQMMSEEAIREMSEEERAELRSKSDSIQRQVAEALRMVTSLEKDLEEDLSDLDKEQVYQEIGHLFEEMYQKYTENKRVWNYLEAVHKDISENFQRFKKQEAPQISLGGPSEGPDLKVYEVNVLVDNSKCQGAPVVVEQHPTHPNLFGRIERQARMGALFTDFTLLKAGSIHQANGGFLVIPVLDLLKLGIPYETLKRSLKQQLAVMEDPAEQMGYMATKGIQPEPIPLDIKVILVGQTDIFQMLQQADSQFSRQFTIRAQMSERMDWEDEVVMGFLGHICGLAREKNRLPLHKTALAALVEEAACLADDRERLTLKLPVMSDLVAECDYWARKSGHDMIMGKDVDLAISARRRRVSMIEDRMRESALRGLIKIETQGEAVGQINGLSVLQAGDHVFGQASRISASHGLGKDGVVAIDRESELSGPIHTKGVMILAGFLRQRFAKLGSLALTANLVFEQSYGMVDGDSASLAELLTLLSSLSGAPLRQDLAVTGSISQHGQVQAIGGVNHKIEGFFNLCKARGFTGTQGVVIPKSNMMNLMLDKEVVETARQGKFNIYAVETVEQALELFSGEEAGQPTSEYDYLPNTIFGRVQNELKRLRQVAMKEAKSAKA